MNIPLFIILTKPRFPKYELFTHTCLNLEECKNKLIINLKNNIMAQVNYPDNVDDYMLLYWYNDDNMNNDFFDYKLFIDNNWTKPWTLQELYEDVINIIHTVDLQDSIYNNKNYYDYHDSDEECEEHNV